MGTLMTLLDIRKLHVQFTHSDKVAVRNLSFTVEAGKTTALVGESGSGKSITAMAIVGINPATHCPVGEIIFNGEDILRMSEDERRGLRGKDISVIFQEPMTALNPLHSIGKQIREVILYHQPQHAANINDIVHSLLDDVELSYLKDRLNNYPHQLSGGERQRVMIAMALANRPKLLIADEPTTALDVTTQAAIMTLLQGLRVKFNMGLLLITHDLHLVKSIADTVVVLKAGVAVEQGNATSIFSHPKHDYTKLLLSAQHESLLVEPSGAASTVLEVKDLSVSYAIEQGFSLRKKRKKIAVHPVSFTLKEGETLGIVGESGSGKTTLGLACARLLPSSGNIVFQSNHIDNLSAKDLFATRAKLQFVFQDPFSSLNPRMNIAQIISEGYRLHIANKDNIDKVVKETLEKVGLDVSMADRYPHEFSGGQRQRINIARAMILKPRCVIFDEPTSALDISLQTQIIAMLKSLQQQEKLSYIFISHDIASVAAISHHVMVMKEGHVVEYNTAKGLFSNPQHSYTKTLINASSLHNVA
jgi:microcin C transport system ATP-binding protein